MMNVLGSTPSVLAPGHSRGWTSVKHAQIGLENLPWGGLELALALEVCLCSLTAEKVGDRSLSHGFP